MAETLLLTHRDVVALLDAGELLPRLRAAFVAYAKRTVPAQRHVVPLPASAPADQLSFGSLRAALGKLREESAR